MSQYMVYKNSNPNSKKAYPYLLDVQSNFLESLETRIVIPLSLLSLFQNREIAKLTPTFKIEGKDYLLLTPQMASINRKQLGSQVSDLSNKHHEILSSIDFLITGF